MRLLQKCIIYTTINETDTQYLLTVAAIWSGRKYRSRPIIFRTLSMEGEYDIR